MSKNNCTYRFNTAAGPVTIQGMANMKAWLAANGEGAILSRAASGDPSNADIRFRSARSVADIKTRALDEIHKTMTHPGKVSFWDRSVGTMRHLAERNPAIKPVFEAAQRFLEDVSLMANDAADFAPRLIPRVDSWRDIVGNLKKVMQGEEIGTLVHN